MANSEIESEQLAVPSQLAAYRFSDNLFLELDEQFSTGQPMKGLIIDLTETGFSVPMHYVFAFSSYAARVLAPSGVMLLLSKGSGIVLEQDRDAMNLTIKCFKPADAIFAHWPFLTELVRTTVPFFDHLQDAASKNSFRAYIARSIVPVLTDSGRKARQQIDPHKPIDFILQGVDDFRNVGGICKVAQRELELDEEQAIGLIKNLESSKYIFPIFNRLDFLVDCYNGQKSFRLGRYFIAAGLMSEGELATLLERQQDIQTSSNKRVMLGRLAIEGGYLNERYLNMLLQEQYVFGGHKTRAVSQDDASVTFGDSLFGSLGTIDPPGLLQSIASTQKPGLLSVESEKGVLLVTFDGGHIVAARLNRLFARDAITEFLVNWHEGIFLFREDLALEALSDAAAIKVRMNKLLLDAALLQDNVKTILEGFPQGQNTVFERVWDFESAWQTLQARELKLYDQTVVSKEDATTIFELAQMIDGLSTVSDLLLQNTLWPSHKSLFALHLLISNHLLTVKDNALFILLRELRSLSSGMVEIFGESDNREMLLASLSAAQERYPSAMSCKVREDSSIFIDMGRLKADGTPVSAILEALKYFMSTYIAYGRRLNKEVVDKLLATSLN